MSAHSPNYHNDHDLISFCKGRKFKTILADPPWQFQNRTGKMAPEHKRLNRYSTMKLDDIKSIPVNEVASNPCHTELLLFGIKGENARTLAPARSQVNLIRTQKREHSRKPDEIFDVIEQCSSGPFLELFARGKRENWILWGNEANGDYAPDWPTYKNATNPIYQMSFLDMETALDIAK